MNAPDKDFFTLADTALTLAFCAFVAWLITRDKK